MEFRLLLLLLSFQLCEVRCGIFFDRLSVFAVVPFAEGGLVVEPTVRDTHLAHLALEDISHEYLVIVRHVHIHAALSIVLILLFSFLNLRRLFLLLFLDSLNMAELICKVELICEVEPCKSLGRGGDSVDD